MTQFKTLKQRLTLRLEQKVLLQEILLLFISPCALILIFLSLIYKQFVTWVSKSFRWQGHQYIAPLSGLDLMFACDDFFHRPHSTLLFFFVLDGVPSKEQIIGDLQSVYETRHDINGRRCFWKLSAYPHKLWGFWFWRKNRNFKIQNHVTFSDEKISTCEDFSTFAEKLIRKGFPEKSPCWHMTIFGNYLDNPLKTVCILRASHIIFDGYSFAKFYFRLSGYSTLPLDFPGIGPSATDLNKSQLLKHFMNRSLHWYKVMTKGLHEYLTIYNSPVDQNVLLNSRVEQKLTSEWNISITPRISIELIKQARKSFNTTFYGITMAAVLGGFRKFIRNNYSSKNTPEFIRSLLPSAKSGHPDNTLCNHWRPIIMKLPMGDLNVAESIVEVQRSLGVAILSPSSEFGAGVFNLLSHLPVAGFIDLFTKFDGLTLISSITPNASQLPPLFGHSVDEIFHVMPIFRETLAGIAWGCMSSNGTIRISVTSDNAHLTKVMVKEVTQLIYEEFTNIFEQAQQLSKL